MRIEEEIYRTMKLIRTVEETIADRYNGEIRNMHTPIHLCDGQEAVAAGVCLELEKEDVVFSNHRSHGHYLAKGGSLEKLIAELHNKETGCCMGRGGSMHVMDMEHGVALASSIVGGNVPIGTGYAMGQKMTHSNNISVVFFGDGASEEGSTYEAICYAVLKRLPVLYVCENNGYAISTPFFIREIKESISDKFSSIIEPHKVDGNDAIAIHDLATALIAQIREGSGPAFMECFTYRTRHHHNVGNGVDNRYRLKSEVDEWREKCPIHRIEKRLCEEGVLCKNKIHDIDAEIHELVEEAFSFAIESECPKSEDLYRGLWK